MDILELISANGTKKLADGITQELGIAYLPLIF